MCEWTAERSLLRDGNSSNAPAHPAVISFASSCPSNDADNPSRDPSDQAQGVIPNYFASEIPFRLHKHEVNLKGAYEVRRSSTSRIIFGDHRSFVAVTELYTIAGSSNLRTIHKDGHIGQSVGSNNLNTVADSTTGHDPTAIIAQR
jgi:hypothetical protein